MVANPNRRPVSASGRRKGTFGDRAFHRARRITKFARRITLNAMNGGAPQTQPVFVMGCQRSGTRIPLSVLEHAPDVLTCGEGAKGYYDGVLLSPDDLLEQRIRRCAFPFLVLKPLCDSHRARHLLARFPASRILWIFRGWPETVQSMSLKWTSGPTAVRKIVEGGLRPDDWRRGGLTRESLEVVSRLYQHDLTFHHAYALLWYLRNRLVLDQDLFNCERVLVVKYEDLTRDPDRHFARVFDFIGESLHPNFISDIEDTRTRVPPALSIPEAVVRTCDALFEEIDRQYHASLGKIARPRGY